MAQYLQPVIEQLKDWQVRTATPERRLEQTLRAEMLLEEIQPKKDYPYDYLWYRITGYRPDHDSRLLLPGEQIQHDLRLYVEDLSDSADIPAEDLGEPVLTVEDLSRMFKVSPKTVSRWRERGLVSRRFVFGSRKRLGFLRSSVDRFVSRHAAQVSRGTRFRQLHESEREEVIRRARRLARAGGCLTEVSQRIARKLQRSPETVRYTIKRFDRENPEQAIFPDAAAPLSEEAKEHVYRQFQEGVPVGEIARRYHRTRTTIYRAVNEARARRLLEEPIDSIYHASFDEPGAEQVVLGPYPESLRDGNGRVRAPKGLPPYLESLYEVPLLTAEQELYLFRKLNYLKYRARRLREQLEPARAKTSVMNRIEDLLQQAREVKNQLIRANLRLVVSIAKRHAGPTRNFFELVSDGNMSLMRAVDKFDFSRGNKFSTYASWAIMKNFARSIPEEDHRRDRFRTGHEALFDIAADNRSNQYDQEVELRGVRHAIARVLDQLDQRERQIIVSRFGLEQQSQPETLEQIGNRFGVTKERVRQLEARALEKLRRLMSEDGAEPAEL